MSYQWKKSGANQLIDLGTLFQPNHHTLVAAAVLGRDEKIPFLYRCFE